jgi:hypothetical protein
MIMKLTRRYKKDHEADQQSSINKIKWAHLNMQLSSFDLKDIMK